MFEKVDMVDKVDWLIFVVFWYGKIMGPLDTTWKIIPDS